jgi:hypothetical protein
MRGGAAAGERNPFRGLVLKTTSRGGYTNRRAGKKDSVRGALLFLEADILDISLFPCVLGRFRRRRTPPRWASSSISRASFLTGRPGGARRDRRFR